MKYAVLAIVMVFMAGIFHVMFIMFDYGFNDPDVGAFRKLPEIMNDSLSPTYQNWTYNQSMLARQFFGVGRFICIALCPILFVIEAVTRKPSTN